MATTIDDDLNVSGNINCARINFADECITSSKIDPLNPIATDRTKHRTVANFSQKFADSGAAERRVVHVAKSAGTISRVRFGATVAAIGDSTAQFNLYKNGSSCLSAAVDLDSGDVAFALLTGTPSGGGTYIAGDVFEVVVTVSAGTGTLPKGLFGSIHFDESP